MIDGIPNDAAIAIKMHPVAWEKLRNFLRVVDHIPLADPMLKSTVDQLTTMIDEGMKNWPLRLPEISQQ